MARIVSPTMPPGAHMLGDVWYHTLSGLTFEWQRTAAGFGVWVQTIIGGPPAVSALAPVTSGTPLCTSSPIAPDNPNPCDLWYHTESGVFFIYYDDGDTRQWVTTQPTKLGDIIVVTGPAGGDLAGSYPNPTIRPDVELIRPTTETLPASDVDTLELVPAQWVNDKFAALPPFPASLPPSGPAGGALAGTYPNPSLAVPYPTTLPPDGPAGGDLSGSYPNPTLRSGVIPAPPTSLPPSGPAGGQLAGTYPNPTIAAGVLPTTLPPSGPAGGDLTGTYPNPTLAAVGSAGTVGTGADTAISITTDTKGRVTSKVAYQITAAAIGAAPIDAPLFTGDARITTDPAAGDNDNSIPSTRWVRALMAAGASISVGVVPPGSPLPNQMWWNSETGVLYLYYNDGNTSQWVPATVPSAAQSGALCLYSESVLTVAASQIIVTCPVGARRVELQLDAQLTGATNDNIWLQVMQGGTPFAGAAYSVQQTLGQNTVNGAQTTVNSASGWFWGNGIRMTGLMVGSLAPGWDNNSVMMSGSFGSTRPSDRLVYSNEWDLLSTGVRNTVTGFRVYSQTAINFLVGSALRCYVVT